MSALVAGGPGKPDGLEAGFFVKPTVFANVSNDMDIARVFGLEAFLEPKTVSAS